MSHPTIVINGVSYSDCPEVDIPKQGGGTAKFFDASDATVTAAHVLNGDKFIGASGEDTGSMPNNGGTGGTIGTKNGTYTIPAGFTSGGSVSLTNVTDLSAANLKSGCSVLGITGTLSAPTISQNSQTKVLSIS